MVVVKLGRIFTSNLGHWRNPICARGRVIVSLTMNHQVSKTTATARDANGVGRDGEEMRLGRGEFDATEMGQAHVGHSLGMIRQTNVGRAGWGHRTE